MDVHIQRNDVRKLLYSRLKKENEVFCFLGWHSQSEIEDAAKMYHIKNAVSPQLTDDVTLTS